MILGLMPICDDYRLTTACAVHFSKYVDKLIFRYDCKSGYRGAEGGKFFHSFFG